MEANERHRGVKHYDTRVAEVCARLNAHGASYVLVGATAMQLWGTTRATRDIDVLIEKTVANARRVLAALGEVGFGLAREWLAEEVVAKPVTIIGDSPRVDVLTVAWSVHYREAARDATVFTVEGVKVPTASIEHLIESKRTGRLQDAADIEVLEEIRRLRAR
jgi:predicted nucleotidyltransferase